MSTLLEYGFEDERSRIAKANKAVMDILMGVSEVPCFDLVNRKSRQIGGGRDRIPRWIKCYPHDFRRPRGFPGYACVNCGTYFPQMDMKPSNTEFHAEAIPD